MSNKVTVVPVSGTYGTVKWLFVKSLKIELLANWNDCFTGTHAELVRDGETIAVMNAEHRIEEELAPIFTELTPNAQKHVCKMLMHAIDSDAAIDSDEVTFNVEVQK